jgi:hypothetical protein
LADLSRQYQHLIENQAQLEVRDLLLSLFPLLAQLYWAGLTLPGDLSVYLEPVSPSQLEQGPPEDASEPPEPVKISDQEYQRVRQFLAVKLGPMDSYFDLYDPYERPENRPQSRHLSEDLATAYRDLTEALMEWERGQHVRAILRWNHTFEARWGHHVLNVLKALHHQARNYGLGWPSSGQRDA